MSTINERLDQARYLVGGVHGWLVAHPKKSIIICLTAGFVLGALIY